MKSKFKDLCESILNEETKPTQEMKDWFKERTDKHIESVQKNWRSLYDTKFQKYLNELDDPEEHILKHDASKYKNPELDGYIFITWKYKQEAEGKKYDIPDDMKQKATDVTNIHVFGNSHHPVYWDDSKTPEDNVINDKDRDKAVEGESVDATSMPNWAIVEMMCDHFAVSQERGTSLRKWEDDNIGTRWKFNKKQTKLIYDLVDFFENKNEKI